MKIQYGSFALNETKSSLVETILGDDLVQLQLRKLRTPKQFKEWNLQLGEFEELKPGTT